MGINDSSISGCSSSSRVKIPFKVCSFACVYLRNPRIRFPVGVIVYASISVMRSREQENSHDVFLPCKICITFTREDRMTACCTAVVSLHVILAIVASCHAWIYYGGDCGNVKKCDSPSCHIQNRIQAFGSRASLKEKIRENGKIQSFQGCKKRVLLYARTVDKI